MKIRQRNKYCYELCPSKLHYKKDLLEIIKKDKTAFYDVQV